MYPPHRASLKIPNIFFKKYEAKLEFRRGGDSNKKPSMGERGMNIFWSNTFKKKFALFVLVYIKINKFLLTMMLFLAKQLEIQSIQIAYCQMDDCDDYGKYVNI